MHTILPLISTLCVSTSAVFVAIGWRLILRGEKEKHKRVMLTAAGFALAFFIVYTTRTVVSGNVSFGGPDYLRIPYLVFLWVHIILSTVSAVYGIVTITLAFREVFEKHRKLGRITAIMWFITAISGLLVYILLYVMYPGDVGSVFDAVLR
jgi:putative membrane protein